MSKQRTVADPWSEPVTVLNRHYLDSHWRELDHTYYIGRGTPLGNPYKVVDYGLEKALELYEADLSRVVETQGAEGGRLNGPAAWAELLRLVDLYKRGIWFNVVCSCKPSKCHGDIVSKTVIYLGQPPQPKEPEMQADADGPLEVGDWVRHINPAVRSHDWHGRIIWISYPDKICDVVWTEVMEGIEVRHPTKNWTYCLPRSPSRYPISLLERIKTKQF